MNIAMNTEEHRGGQIFHCPLVVHPQGLSDIIPGLKERCNKEAAVMVVYEL